MAKKTQMERIEEFNESKVLSCDCPFPKGIRSWSGSQSNEWFMDAITDPEAYAYQNLENRLVDRRGRRAEKHSHVVRAVKELLQEADDIFEPSIQFYSGVAQLTPEIVAITRTASGQSNNSRGWCRGNPRYTWTLHSKLPPKTANLHYNYDGSEVKSSWETHERTPMNIPAWWLNPSKKVRGVAEWLDVYSLRRVSLTKILTAKAEYYMALQMFMIPNGRLYEMRREQCLYGGDFTREAIDEIVDENNGLSGHYWEVKGKAGMVKRQGEHYPLSYYRSHQTYSGHPEERGWLAGIPLWSIPCDDTPTLAPTSEQALLLVRAELREMRGKYNAICADIKGYEEIIPTLEKEAEEMAAEIKLLAVKIT
jgi:hypothetical protein